MEWSGLKLSYIIVIEVDAVFRNFYTQKMYFSLNYKFRVLFCESHGVLFNFCRKLYVFTLLLLDYILLFLLSSLAFFHLFYFFGSRSVVYIIRGAVIYICLCAEGINVVLVLNLDNFFRHNRDFTKFPVFELVDVILSKNGDRYIIEAP